MADMNLMALAVYSALINWTALLLAVLMVVKVFQLFTSLGVLKGIPGLGGGGGSGDRGGGNGGSGDGGGKGRDDGKPEDDEAKKFEEGVKNPAYLKVMVKNEDDKPVQGADVTIKTPKGRYGPHATNKDGLAPAMQFRRVPSGVEIKIDVVFWLKREEKYKSRKRSKWLLGMTKKRKLTVSDKIPGLEPGAEVVYEVQLPFKSEEIRGFEPFIISVDTSAPGHIRTRAIIKSSTGD